MPLFYFVLKTGREKIPDREGLELPDKATARAHAEVVAQELMRNRETKTRSWRLEVCDENLDACFELLFGAIDVSMAHLEPAYRKSVESLAWSTATLFDAVDEVRTSLCDVRQTLARADEIMARLHHQSSTLEKRP